MVDTRAIAIIRTASHDCLAVNFEYVLAELYQAPISGNWEGAASVVGEFVGRRHVVLGRVCRRKGLGLRAHTGFGRAKYEEINSRFKADADAYVASLSAKPNGRANHGLNAPLESKGYFNLDTYMRQSFGVTAELGAILKVDQVGEEFVSIMRAVDDLREDTAAATKFTMVLPHLRKAIEAATAYERRKAYTAGLEAAFEVLSAAVFHCAHDARVIEMNAAARKILESANGIRVVNGRLSFADKDAEAVFRVEIGRSPTLGSPNRVRFAAPRKGAFLPLWATIVGNKKGGAIVLIEDPDRDFLPRREILETVAALSPAQARAAYLAAAGYSTADIAQELGVSAHTALTHLRRAMHKLDCSNRLSLVTRLAALKGVSD